MAFKFLARILTGRDKKEEAPPELRDTIPAPEPDSEVPAAVSDVRTVRVLTREQLRRLVYENFVKENMKVDLWPRVFMDYMVDMLMTAQNDRTLYYFFKNDPLVDFYRVFRQSKEDAEKTGAYAKPFFLMALAEWLGGVYFTRTKRDGTKESGWFVLPCTAEDLDMTAPLVTVARQKLKNLETEQIPLFDVFSGFKIE
jgi:hypothetical protein